MERKSSAILMLSVSFLIIGNLIGAGILALPINTGLSGFSASLIGMLFVTLLMFFSAIVLAKESVHTRQDNFNYPSLYGTHLGSTGKWLAIVANLIILYGLITAYVSGSTTIIINLLNITLPQWVVMIIYFLIITGLNICEMRLITKYNAIFVILMWISFAVIVYMASWDVNYHNFSYSDWPFLTSAVPIIVAGCFYHNIIPTACRILNWDKRAILTAIIIGTVVGYLMNSLWMYVSIGSLPLTGDNSIYTAFTNEMPATVPMAKFLHSDTFTLFSMLFALLAIATSYLTIGAGLQDFVRDLLENYFKRSSRMLVIAFSFGPPLLIALVYPGIFLKSLNVVGGVGIVLLFGVLPAIIVLKNAGKIWSRPLRIIGIFCLVLFTTILLIEIAQETGFLKIPPEVEDWTNYVRHR